MFFTQLIIFAFCLNGGIPFRLFNAEGKLRLSRHHVRHRQTRNIKNSADDCIITTQTGKIRGKNVNMKNNGLEPVMQYLGIPYAEPPIGILRWKKTKKKEPWQGRFIENTTFLKF